MKKIAVVTSQGGMTCAYSAGAVVALAEEYGLREPAMAVGCSGSTGTLAYYVAKQYESIRRIWTELLSTPSFISFWRRKTMIDIDYLIDDVFRRQDPLDVDAVAASPTDLYLAATHVQTGQARFFSNRDDTDMFEALRASSAMPIFYNKHVTIGGEEYVDGALSATLGDAVAFARERGAEKVIAIDTSTRSALRHLLLRTYALGKGEGIRSAVRRHCAQPAYQPSDPDVHLLRPREPLPISTLDNCEQHVALAFQRGYEDVRQDEYLQQLL